MAAIEHDGHWVHCGFCRSPLRTAALVPVQIVFSPDGQTTQQSAADADGADTVVCTNCEAPLGTVSSVAADVVRVTRDAQLIRQHVEAGA